MSETSEHIITVESTQLYRGVVSAEMAEALTSGPQLDFHEELKLTYECSCGRRFRKGETAREHLDFYGGHR